MPSQMGTRESVQILRLQDLSMEYLDVCIRNGRLGGKGNTDHWEYRK